MTIHNSHDIAAEHGNVWISGISSAGFSDALRGGKRCDWTLHPPAGKKFTPDASEKLSLHQDGVHVFVTFEDAARFAEKHFGVIGWKRDKFGGYHPSASDHDVPCEIRIASKERWTQFYPCDKRRKPGEEACGLHLAAANRRAEADRKDQESRDRSEAGSQIAQDAVDALEEMGVKAAINYESRRSFADSGYLGVDQDPRRGHLGAGA